MSARDVLGHLIDSHRDMPGYVGLTSDLTGSVDADPAGAWTEARDAMQALLDDPERATLTYDGFFGPTSLEQTVDRFLGFDLLIHGWDIARATGQDETLPAGEVTQVYASAQSLGDTPALWRCLRTRAGGLQRRIRAGPAAGSARPRPLISRHSAAVWLPEMSALADYRLMHACPQYVHQASASHAFRPGWGNEP